MSKYVPYKVLVIDIETSPILGFVWGLWNQNLGLEQIVEDWYVLSYCAKWLHEDEYMYEDNRDRGYRKEKPIVKSIHKLLDEADMVIAHNGNRFDIPKLNSKFFEYGLKPPSPFKSIDTLMFAKKHFRETSNKLAFLTDKYCVVKKRDHGKFPGFKLWKECMAGNMEAWEEMEDYNVHDVLALEELYLKIRPWWSGHPSVAVFDAQDRCACTRCGSSKVHARGYAYTNVGKFRRYRCTECGAWSRGRNSVIDKKSKKSLLTNAVRL